MGISERARREKQRLRVLQSSKIMKERNKNKPEEKSHVNTETTICSRCSFNSTYEWLRCPLCGAEKDA